MNSSLPRKFEGLQSLRAVAAISVLGYHGAAIEREAGQGYAKLLGVFEYFGYAGVDLFFVLSGFIIAWTAKNYSPDLRGVSDYTGERLARIFPIFWLIWLISALVYFVVFKQSYCHPDDVFSSTSISLSLSRQQGHCILPQAWTLSWELLFYLVVGALLPLFLRHKPWVAGAWAALVLANLAFGFTQALLLSYFCLYFIVGIVIASLMERRAIIAPHAFVVIGTVWLVGAALANWRFGIAADKLLPRFLGFGVGSAMLIYGIVGAESSGVVKVQRTMSFLGDASYSIYLFHVTALFLMARLYVATPWPALHYAWVLALLAVPLALSATLYLLVEKPVMKWFRSHRNGLVKMGAVAGMGAIVMLGAPLLVNSAPNTGVAVPDPTQKPVPLAAVASSSDGAVRVIQANDVDAIAQLMACSLDSLNGVAPGSAGIDGDGTLALSGWSQYPDEAESMTIVLRGEQAYAFQARLGQARPDIARITNSPVPISDILASSQLAGIAAGLYTVIFVRSGELGLAKCIAGAGVQIR